MPSFLTILKKIRPVKIRTQLILGISLVHLVLMTFFVFDMVNRQRNSLKKLNHDQSLSFVSDFAVNSVDLLIANDFDALERLTVSHINFPNLKYAMILSPDGVVLAHTDIKYVGTNPADSISQQLKGATHSKTLIENDNALDIAVPIFADAKIIGWARAGIGQDYIQDNLAAIVQDGIIYIIIALIAGTLFAVLIGNTLTAGLYKLISTVDKVKAGDRNVRVAPFETFELSELGTAFNQMLDDVGAKENLLSMVIDNMPVGVWIFNEKREIISSNWAGRQIWGGLKNTERANYKAWFHDTKKLIEPHQWASTRAIQKGEITINEEIEIETIDGKRKFILNSAIPLKGKGNEIIGAIAINVDITERKKITEQLALSESTLSSAFENSAIGISLVLPDGKWIRVNKALCRIVGYSEEELLSLSFQDITHPDDLEADLVLVGRTLSGEMDSYHMEKRYFRKDGTVVWVLLSVSLVRDGQNQPLFFVSQIQDISERKKSETVIRESEEKFRKLVEETLVGVFIIQNGRFVYVNPQFEKITGYSRTVLLNEMSFEQLIHKDDREKEWRNDVSEAIAGKPPDHYFLKAIKKDGSALQLEIIASAITYQAKPAIIGTVIDITKQVAEEKRISKAVTDAQENERQQISMELHDNVKQMMAASLLNIDFLRMIVKDEETAVPIISNIKNYLREAIEELRRITHQLAPSIDEKVSLEEKIKTIVETMNVSKSITVHYRFEKLEETIRMDVQLALFRILQEQLTNILKYAKASSVDITVQKNNSEIWMAIEDNGIGFGNGIIKKGLGLENIKRRVQVFNGNFSIQSSPGKGCRLDVQIPVN